MFILLQIYFATTQNWERFLHNWYMVGIYVALRIVVGFLQLALASYFNDRGRTLKYVVFAPWYLLIYWMVNTWTIVYEFIPTWRKVWRHRDGGAWVSPKRSSSLQSIHPE